MSYGGPPGFGAAPPGSPYGAPPGGGPGGQYPPAPGSAYPPAPGSAYPPSPGYGAPPGGGYGAPPPGGGYGAPPPGGGYGAPPGGGYGAPPPSSGYGAPPSGSPYGASPGGSSPYGPPPGGAPPGGGYGPPGGAPPGGPYGAPPPGGGYGAAPPGGGGPPGGGYGAAPPGGGGPPSGGYGAAPPGGGGPPGGAGGGYGAAPPASATGGYGTPPPGQPGQAAGGSEYQRPANVATGKRKALLVGINYIGHAKGRLKGCINDVKNIYSFLTLGAGFKREDIMVLTDDQSNPTFQPTKANIEQGMKWLVEDAKSGDSLFFHFSGHGGQSKDNTYLEDDGMNETICPVDYQTAGQIVDDNIHNMLVKPLPEGVKLTALFDSCHSGTAMDLPYIHKSSDSRYKDAHKDESNSFWKRHNKFSLKKGITSQIASHLGGEVMHHVKHEARKKINAALNASKADVIQFSGCRDEQTSADTTVGGEATGAMSYAFIEAMKRNPNVTYDGLLQCMREILHDGPKQFRQVPQMSYGKEGMDMDQPFII